MSRSSLAFRLVMILSLLVFGILALIVWLRWYATELWIQGSVRNSDAPWSQPVIHIVHTRFMQDQPDLHALGWARFELFRTVCLPSMVQQSLQINRDGHIHDDGDHPTDSKSRVAIETGGRSHKFLWIIQTDPKLDKSIREALVETLLPYDNFYLVGSNRNFGFALNGKDDAEMGGSWKDGEEGKDLFRSPIYTGNVPTLRQAHLARLRVPVLETRLDADDALHSRYLELVQQVSMDKLRQYPQDNDAAGTTDDIRSGANSGSKNGLQWLYLCTHIHFEWYTSTPTNDLNPVEHSHFCITAGLTVVFGRDTPEVPEYPHDKLAKKLYQSNECGIKGECVHLIPNADPTVLDSVAAIGVDEDELRLFFGALRSRSLTSAGMLNTKPEEELRFSKARRAAFWGLASKLFGIDRERVEELQQYLQEHRVDIAKDNLKGQCTKGHSCKESSKAELQKIIDIPDASPTGIHGTME